MLAIIGKTALVILYGLYGLAIVGAVVQDVQTNHVDKPLMQGCHFSLVTEWWEDAPHLSDTVLCYQTTRLP